MAISKSVVEEWIQKIQKELDRAMHFWTEHSHDDVHGGFFNCIGSNGKIYDETKYMWLQARQVWMYFRLYIEKNRFRSKKLLEPAIRGADFLLRCLIVRDKCKRCPFSVTRQGLATKVQRNLFSECFFVMAMSEAWRATQNKKYKDAAISMIDQITHWCLVDDSGLGKDNLQGLVPTSSLAVPMMALCLNEQMQTCGLNFDHQNAFAEWGVKAILLHIQRKNTVVLENVTPSGSELLGSKGRLLIPGHSVECGWFLLQHAVAKNDKMLAEKACTIFIKESFKRGWDSEFGGLFYFLDVDGFCPEPLEWNMKLWWPHNEAMIAFLMAYQYKKESYFFEKFVSVAEYAFSKFSNKEKGEWVGYLNVEGDVSSNFVGGAWKGCFHVPRALYLCEDMLMSIEKSFI